LKRLLWGPRNHFLHFLMSNFILRGAQMEVIRRVRKQELPYENSTRLRQS
jgi:hypothetical protein